MQHGAEKSFPHHPLSSRKLPLSLKQGLLQKLYGITVWELHVLLHYVRTAAKGILGTQSSKGADTWISPQASQPAEPAGDI